MDLLMSAKERDRLRSLAQVEAGQLGRVEAAGRLKLSVRQVARLLVRYREEGDGGLVHRSRGRPSNRRIAGEVREGALKELSGPYKGFGPTLASEKLAERDGIAVSRETVRKWQSEAGLRHPRRRGAPHRSWRVRRSGFGSLVQMDTSEHAWLGDEGEECVLQSMIDDATSRVQLRFAPSDTTASNMSLLREWLTRYGRPLGLYVDRASHFTVNRPSTVEEDLLGKEPATQIGRALRELGIEHVVAYSPQAKGRVERLFGTCQDRLVKELALRGIRTIAEANRYLDEEFVPLWEERWTVAPASPADAHRSVEGYDLAAILSHQEERTVQSDYTIRYRNVRYQIARGNVTAGLRGAKVTVEERLDGSVHLRWRSRYLEHESRGDARLRPPAAAATPKPRRGYSGHKPAADHPWKQPYDRALRARAAAAGPGDEHGAPSSGVKGLRSATRTATPPLTPPAGAQDRLTVAGRRRNLATPP